MVPLLTSVGGEEDKRLWTIATEYVAVAKVQGMTETCVQWTTNEVAASPGWRAESNMIEAVVEALMVPRH